MKTDLELIHRLVLEELAGVISDEDLAYLKKTIREDPEAFRVWEETRSILDTPDVKAFLEKPRPIDAIFNATIRPKRNGFWGFSLSLVAVLVVSLCVYFFYPNPQNEPIAKPFNVKNIRLDLPGSETVDLSEQQGDVKVNSFSLKNDNKSLSVKADYASARLATLTIPEGKDYKLTLDDGTIIWLNSATTLRFPITFLDATREIYLNGEAYLEVAKNTKPFIVHLQDASIKVLGTSFNVNTYNPNKIQVALVNGAIRMEMLNDSVQLIPGQLMTVLPGKAAEICTFDEETLLSWRKGVYLFHDTYLSEITQVLPRWFGKTVIMDYPARKNVRFTGVINRNKPLEESLELLKATNGLDYYIKKDTIHIK
ncbi:FecR family protein [Chitinophaga sancti]|uniref:FecR family protein n=1 Tax=Chitinophaga sancti TaxID=1004 RepID=A0A1K1T1M4_9BACT|nr:FecR family protein [Chitinophaga sancti]WQD59625.1 FecR family protein [Chitinophaga sancti]WQG88244.1 FecR family protein [Chitinophaga sancti]SFW90537.1 FecR family protein [Chitinophaga sancti]